MPEIDKPKAPMLEQFEALYPQLISGIMSAGNVVMTLSQTVIISFGLLVILVVLLIVEQHGIQDGLQWFMADVQMAAFAGSAVVALNLMVDLKIVHVEHEANYKHPRTMAWSLRLWIRDVAYRLGIGKTWKPRAQSPAQRFISLRSFLTVVIFIVALSGRMRLAIQQVSQDESGGKVAYYDGIGNILHSSSLADLVAWTGGTLFTMLALLSVQNLTHYMAMVVTEVQDDLKRRLKNAKASATRLRNRETRAVARISTSSVDAYEMERLRDNSLDPIKHKRGDKTVYECPTCHKEMTRSGWSRHTCRHVNTVAGVSQHALNLLSTDAQHAQQTRNVADVE